MKPFLPDQDEGPAKYVDAKPGTQFLCMIILEAVNFNKTLLFPYMPYVKKVVVVKPVATRPLLETPSADPASVQTALAAATLMASLDQKDGYQTLPLDFDDSRASSFANLKSVLNEALNTRQPPLDNYDETRIKRHQGISCELA